MSRLERADERQQRETKEWQFWKEGEMWDVWAALTEPFPSEEGKLQSIKTVAKQQKTIKKKKEEKNIQTTSTCV